MSPAPLENTPDVTRLRANPTLRAELARWIREGDHLANIDAATIVLPEKFAAMRAVSVTPRGLGRQANRPFSRIFAEAELRDLPLGAATHAGSPAALLRRLDDLTCSGCHEARSVAGFHLLGADREGTLPENSLAVPFSPHFERDQPRRRAVLQAMKEGKPPVFTRPLAERATSGDAGYGAHCGLGDPGFRSWTCDAGFRCDRYDAPRNDATVGVCLPATPGGVGDPCEMAALLPHPDAHRDGVRGAHESSCTGTAACNTNAVGFPGGMCTPSCDALPAGAACGKIAVLDTFNACLARNESFERCLKEHGAPAGLRQCGAGNPCRDDYVCAGPPGHGACIPPYFIFQLRVDGHGVASTR
jgi:hypothetical protein